MSVLNVVLVVIGLALFAAAVGTWQIEQTTDSQPEADLAAPYREGLHAAVRLQRVAQDLEQQIYAAAAEGAESEARTGRRS